MKRRTILFTLSVLALPAPRGLPADRPDRELPEVSWEDAADHVGEECTVVGQVVMAKSIGSICFLNFHHDYRTHFTVVIKRESFDRFPEPPETMYADKHVKVTGKIIEYRGKPEIIVTGPDQIRIVNEAVIASVPVATQPASPVPAPRTPASQPAAGQTTRTPPAAQAAPRPFDGIVTVASYNVANLFDDHDDPYHRDEGTPPKPSDELEEVAATIRRVNADVIALQEVENRGYLEQFNQALLGDMGYEQVVLFEGNDQRGIDVAVLSRLPVGPVTSYRHVTYRNADGRAARFRRDLLRVRIEPPTGQSFDLFVVHLKSKRGGEPAAVVRLGEATAARKVLDGVLAENPEVCFALCGDPNDTFDSEVIGTLVGGGPTALQSFFSEVPEEQQITFNREPYRSMIDFMLCSPGLARHYQPGSFRVYPGTLENSGSDHNPISARFDLR